MIADPLPSRHSQFVFFIIIRSPDSARIQNDFSLAQFDVKSAHFTARHSCLPLFYVEMNRLTWKFFRPHLNYANTTSVSTHCYFSFILHFVEMPAIFSTHHPVASNSSLPQQYNGSATCDERSPPLPGKPDGHAAADRTGCPRRSSWSTLGPSSPFCRNHGDCSTFELANNANECDLGSNPGEGAKKKKKGKKERKKENQEAR